jgi:hypothetical protein
MYQMRHNTSHHSYRLKQPTHDQPEDKNIDERPRSVTFAWSYEKGPIVRGGEYHGCEHRTDQRYQCCPEEQFLEYRGERCDQPDVPVPRFDRRKALETPSVIATARQHAYDRTREEQEDADTHPGCDIDEVRMRRTVQRGDPPGILREVLELQETKRQCDGQMPRGVEKVGPKVSWCDFNAYAYRHGDLCAEVDREPTDAMRRL